MAHDLFVARGLLRHPYLVEFAWVGVIAVMSWMLSQEVASAEQTRDALASTQDRADTILRAIQDAVITTDLKGRIQHLNPAAERLLDVQLSEAEGVPIVRYMEITSPETHAVVSDPVRYAVGRPANPYGKLPQLVTLDGNERRVDLGGVPLKDREGRVQGAILVLRDLTLQHEALDTLKHAKKMEAVGQLAGGAAHDLNNLLTPILSYVELVQRQKELSPRSRQFLDQVRDAGQRAAALTRQLLAVSRKQVLDVQVIPVADFVRQSKPILERLVGEKIKLEVDLDDASGNVQADAGQLEQVLLNLINNAADAIEGRGTVRIRVRPLGEGELCIEVSDTGVGMSAETADRIFEPFFTTKQRGKGTGLGLASVRGIVEQHGGSVYVDSEPGLGSSFEIILPTTRSEQPDSAIRALPATELATGTEHILVVEDDPGVRSLIHDALSQLGYTVHAADGMTMAVAVARSEPVELLLSDVILPGADGPQVREAVLAELAMPCLFMTGHADDRLGAHGFLPPGTKVLRKPFTVAELGQRVRQVLDTYQKDASFAEDDARRLYARQEQN